MYQRPGKNSLSDLPTTFVPHADFTVSNPGLSGGKPVSDLSM